MSSGTLNPRDDCWRSRDFAEDVTRSTTKTKDKDAGKNQEKSSKNPKAIRAQAKSVSECQNLGIQQGGDPLPIGSGDEISGHFNPNKMKP